MNNFDLAFEFIMDHEDRHRTGRVTSDSGGITKYGIAQRFNSGVDVLNLTLDAAKEVYRAKYWNAFHLDQVNSPAVAAKIADMMVNPGPVSAKIVQRLVGTPEDGILGAFTFARINQAKPEELLQALCEAQAGHYREQANKAAEEGRPYPLDGLLVRAADKPAPSVDVNTGGQG